MSYILDALKRADSERERGTVPGLRSQSAAAAGTTARPRRGRRAALILGGLGLLLLAASFVPMWWADQASAPAPGASSTTVTGKPDPAAPPANEAPVGQAPAAAPVSGEPATSMSEATSQLPPSPILAPPPPRPAPAPAAAPAKAPAAAPGSATDSSPATPKDAKAPTETARVPTFAELSAEARARLPAVNVTGSSYSANPAHRMLIANGKVVLEGQEVAPGLTLERIDQHSAVLNHQGMRYSIGY